MNYAEVLEKYLYRIARGELRDLNPLIPLIPPSILFMPVISETSRGNKTHLKLPIVERQNKKYLPVFLRKSHLMSTYERIRMSPQEIKGETLLEMLPSTLGILFEPNSSLEVTFSRKDLGLDDYEQDKQVSLVENRIKSNEPVSARALEDLFSGGQQKVTPLVEVKRLEDALKAELVCYSEVLEAFFIPHTSSYSDAILGILREEMDDERRYDLTESVARISTNFYGYAGAIEIFDDLIDPNANAWDRFKTEVPFYKQDNITDKIEISKTSSMDPNKEGLLGSLGSLKKTGLKIFYR